ALMQKKLSDYFQLLVDSKDLLKYVDLETKLLVTTRMHNFTSREFYEDWALLRNDVTGVIFVGSLVGLRVIDCNLYLKAEELAKQVTSFRLFSLQFNRLRRFIFERLTCVDVLI